MKFKNQKCYMCDAPATSWEHVPPESFHLEGLREHLIKVPSCHAHNERNSLDVEAIRNIIPTGRLTNEVGMSIALGPAKRSFVRSPVLLKKTFRDNLAILLDGRPTIAFAADIQRLNCIMSSIAYGMYYHVFGERFPFEWKSFNPDMISRVSLTSGMPDGLDEFRHLLGTLPYDKIPTPQPEVFCCGLFVANDGILKVFRFLFYGGITYYVYTKPNDVLDPVEITPMTCV